MADSMIQLPVDSTGKKIATQSLLIGADTVHRQEIIITGVSALQRAVVLAADPASNDYAIAVRPIPSATATPVSQSAAPWSIKLVTPNDDTVMDETNDAVRVNIVAGAAAGGTSSAFNAAVPANGTAIGASDGTSMQAPRLFDLDSGAGNQYVLGVSLRGMPKAGGATVISSLVAGSVEALAVALIDPSGNHMGGSVAHDADASAESPALNGGYASLGRPSAVSADNDAVRAWYTRTGQAIVTALPYDRGGCLIKRDLDLDETELEIKATRGQLYGYYIANTHATDWVYVKLYNDTAANVSVGTTTPVDTLAIPPKGAANLWCPQGIEFDAAICAAATTGVADADTTAPAANQVVANFWYM